MSSELRNSVYSAFRHPKLAPLLPPETVGNETLASWFDVSGLATTSMGVAASALTRLTGTESSTSPTVKLNKRLANLWFGMTLQPEGWSLPSAWDSIAGDYRCKDGWIRLHTNAPHHKRAALLVLHCEESRESVAKSVSQWFAAELEMAIVNAGGAVAQMRSIEAWRKHPQGKEMAQASLVDWQYSPGERWHRAFNPERPLAGVRVLDLTRVLAGPVATRFLAGFGAQVLRIDPMDWDEPGVVPEVTLGKHCAGLNLKTPRGLAQFKALIKDADVLVHGYRADALNNLGLGLAQRKSINPNLIDVCLNAYGWQGPWQNRRGFDSLMQMSTGIAHWGMVHSGTGKPTPLPVQALDHATGYFMAAAVIQALELRMQGIVASAQCSLAATAQLLIETASEKPTAAMANIKASDFSPVIEQTDWGPARRIAYPLTFSSFVPTWQNGAVKLRTSPARW